MSALGQKQTPTYGLVEVSSNSDHLPQPFLTASLFNARARTNLRRRPPANLAIDQNPAEPAVTGLANLLVRRVALRVTLAPTLKSSESSVSRARVTEWPIWMINGALLRLPKLPRFKHAHGRRILTQEMGGVLTALPITR